MARHCADCSHDELRVLAKYLRDKTKTWTPRVAKTVRAARALIEAGFEYVTDMDDLKIFRKRK